MLLDPILHDLRPVPNRAQVRSRYGVQAQAGLSKLAMALEASRTMREQTLDSVVAARELRRVKRPD